MKAIAEAWKKSPVLRMVSRSIAVAVVSYVMGAFQAGEALTLTGLYLAAGTSGGTAILGVLTPLEPFVGVNKATVEVPSPPAQPA